MAGTTTASPAGRLAHRLGDASGRATRAAAVSALALVAALAAGRVVAQAEAPLSSESAVSDLLAQMRRNGTLTPAAEAALRRRAETTSRFGLSETVPPPPPREAPAPSVVAPVAPAPAVGTGSLPIADNGPAPPPSSSMVVNLMRLLVRQGVITEAAADQLRREAEVSADRARAAAGGSASAGAQVLAAGQAPPPGVIRVPYIPQVVRTQITDDVKKDVLAQAQAEGWANPHIVPSWLDKVHFFGDLRFRDEYDLYSRNNVGQFIDYNTFNNSGPTDINAATNPNGLPFINTQQDRLNQLSIRARFGVQFQPADWVSLTFRLGSGQDSGPVSNTQLLGGGLTKKDIWLDQAYLTLTPAGIGSFYFGRNPDLFMHTDLLFDDNLEFDGAVAITDQPTPIDGLRVFGAGGVFPLGYVAGAFPADSATKAPDSGKWLFAAQAGVQYKPTESGRSIRAAASLYDYSNVAGQLSAPCALYTGVKQCSTDSSRPAYMQKGNTLFLIRNITPDPNANIDTGTPEPQYVGLSYDYREVDLVAEFETPLFGSVRGLVTGDFVRNLAYDPGRILAAGAVNPGVAPVTNFNSATNTYQSGPNAFNIRVTVGHLRPTFRGDWNIQVGYKYIEPDAVIDAFNSNDFDMGGTNAKGYYVIGSYYLAKNTWIDGRYFSATEVFGPPLAIDVLQLELQTRF
jgi:hypothetical protein